MSTLLVLFVLLLPMDLTAQNTRLSGSDADGIVAMLVDSIAPEGGPIGQRAPAERPIFLDLQRSKESFRPALEEGDSLTLDAVDRVDRSRSREEAVVCATRRVDGAGPCTVHDDGVLFSIEGVESAEEAGTFQVEVLVLWNRFDAIPEGVRGEGALQGFGMDIYVSRVDGSWQVARYGGARAIN